MMKAELKRLHSPDVFELSKYIPEEKDCFAFLLQMFVGEKDKEGEESFDMIVCTPKWLIKNNNQSEIIIGSHYLIMFEYNYQKLYNKLKVIIDSVNGETWDDIGLKIGKIGKWEFEDYQP